MKKRILSVILTGAFACAALAGCGSSSASSTATSTAASTSTAAASSTVQEAVSSTETTDAAATVDAAGGFEEQPIQTADGTVFQDEELGGLLSMNGVYFQAVPMSGGYEDISDYDIHIEADISALAGNTLGYGAGDWIPYLSVSYDIKDSATGEDVTSGNFMPMSASDGPHYGQNIALDPGTYDLTISISPQEDTYLIHLDSETGPGGTWDDYFKDGALTYTFEKWAFPGLEQ